MKTIRIFEEVLLDNYTIINKFVTPRYIKYLKSDLNYIYLLYDPREILKFDLTTSTFFTIKDNDLILINEENIMELLQ